MSRIIHIWILTIYLITSCFVIGLNKWAAGKESASGSFTDWLICSMTIPVSDNPEDTTEIPFLFKDPSEDESVVLNYYPTISTFEFCSIDYTFHGEKKIKDPLLNIFSPPPQLI